MTDVVVAARASTGSGHFRPFAPRRARPQSGAERDAQHTRRAFTRNSKFLRKCARGASGRTCHRPV